MRRRGPALALLLAAGLGASGCGDAQKFPDDDPRTAVSRLLQAANGEANGLRACGLLSDAARARFDRGPSGSCRVALSKAPALLPGEVDEPTSFDRVISKLRFSVRQQGDRARVEVRGRGALLRFSLIRVHGAQAEGGPDTEGNAGIPWRVDRGVEQLLNDKPIPRADEPAGAGRR
ncbi:hypothetical protein [Patulibacter defluvii]|uniref:hypothetical protein n=1 Tax=Patulibacter defluvii TaxID=3095358 RepID=UPI002A755659|nr:hypothetical protein [Patulibacter sp. DM4]